MWTRTRSSRPLCKSRSSASLIYNLIVSITLAFNNVFSFEERQLSTPENGRVVPLNKRQLAYLSPRLGVLNNIPFAIPFNVRVEIFRQFVQNDIISRGYMPWRGRMGAAKVVIRRDHIAQDGFDRLADADLRAPIAITFIDNFGNEECVHDS